MFPESKKVPTLSYINKNIASVRKQEAEVRKRIRALDRLYNARISLIAAHAELDKAMNLEKNIHFSLSEEE